MDIAQSLVCECCKLRDITVRMTNGHLPGLGDKEVRATLCKRCIAENHSLGACRGCRMPVWHCARMSHMSAQHPRELQEAANRPRPQSVKPKTIARYYSGNAQRPHQRRR